MAHLGVGGAWLDQSPPSRPQSRTSLTLLQATNQATINYHQDATVKTFADKHGPSLGQGILNLCNVADEAGLPEVHTALVNCPKSWEYAVITVLSSLSMLTQCYGSPDLLGQCTPRYHMPSGQCLPLLHPGRHWAHLWQGTFSRSPLCARDTRKPPMPRLLVHNALLVESRTSTLLSDVKTITSNDVRFPMEVYVAVEKLCGWSVAINVFPRNQPPCSQSRSVMPSGP